jgi:hypothetical protein
MWAVDMIKAKQVSLRSCQRNPSIFVDNNERGGGGVERATQCTCPATARSRPRLNEVSRPARSVVNGVSRSDGPVRIVCMYAMHTAEISTRAGDNLRTFLCCLSLQCHYRGLLYFLLPFIVLPFPFNFHYPLLSHLKKKLSTKARSNMSPVLYSFFLNIFPFSFPMPMLYMYLSVD